MFRRKRRRFKGIWLPPSPVNSIAGQVTGGLIASPSANAIKSGTLAIPGALGFGAVRDSALVGDLNSELVVGEGALAVAGYQSGTMADLSFGYSLRRIVGKFACFIEQDNVADDVAGTFVITAGIIVRRVDENGDPVENDLFPDSYEAWRDPWVWRRSWVLQNAGATPGAVGGWQNCIAPAANWQYGSVADGPHVDQKTRRTIKSEERLFLDVSGIALNGSEEQITTAVNYVYDFRFFGRVFSSAGNRGNAAR